MNQLHPGARWQFRIRGYFFLGIIAIFLGVWIIPLLTGYLLEFWGDSSNSIITYFLLSVFGYIIFVFVASEIYARMSYNRWFYELTDVELKLERGIIWKSFSNVPYERIQNVDVYRGIIARIFGFSSVLIQTAGYSAYPHAEAYIPALDVNQAEQIRTFVIKKITNRKK